MPNSSRRGFFKFLAALGAAPVLDRIGALLPVETAERIGISPYSGLGAELAAITRKAFTPSIYTQIYKVPPLLTRSARIDLEDYV